MYYLHLTEGERGLPYLLKMLLANDDDQLLDEEIFGLTSTGQSKDFFILDNHLSFLLS